MSQPKWKANAAAVKEMIARANELVEVANWNEKDPYVAGFVAFQESETGTKFYFTSGESSRYMSKELRVAFRFASEEAARAALPANDGYGVEAVAAKKRKVADG